MGVAQSLGNVQAWCCGADDSDEQRWLPGRRRLNGRVKDTPVMPARTANSRSKPITVQGPAYSEGSLESKYDMLAEIGHGGTSVVYRCKNRRSGNEHACKIIDRRSIQAKHNVLMEQFQVEVQVLQSMDHPNIIRIDDVYITDSKICMVTEFMGGGELFDYIVEKGTLSELEASAIVRKITSAVAYMHACGVVHRDLKPENLMLTDKHRGAEVKIIDFGLAKLLDADNTTASFLGTRGYLAPEMLQRQAYTMSVDMWALGVIVYVLLCGCLPFNDDGSRIPNLSAARAKFGLRFPRWANGLSESAKDLLRHLLEVDATKRYTAEQAMAHLWVTGQRTPNQPLKSPNYLRTIKKERLLAKQNGNNHGNNRDVSEAHDQSLRLASRRQSH